MVTAKKSRKLRLGVWGCGGHAVNHLRHMPEGIEAVALCDTNAVATPRLKIEFKLHATCFTNINEFLIHPMDAVFIATPDQFHAPQIGMALEHGLHVLAEKPLAVDEAQFAYLKQLAELARRKKLTFLTCHPRRFDPRYQWAKFALPLVKSYLGEPKAMFFTFDYPAPSDWKNKRGLCMDHVNHEVDGMGYLLGVADFFATRHFDSPEQYHVGGSRVDGVNFSFSGVRSARIKNWNESREILTIKFERGSIEVRSHDPIVWISQTGVYPVVECRIPPRGHHFERYRDVMQNFADVVQGIAEPYVSVEEMLTNTAAGVYLTTRGHYNTKEEQ